MGTVGTKAGKTENGNGSAAPEGLIRREDILKEMEKILQLYKEVGEVIQKLKELLGRWKHTPINVCILGERGAGKSSFINNMLQENVAETRTKECTKEPKKYSHPMNDKFLFWDLPGFGAKLYPRLNQYISKLDIAQYDILLFLHCITFSEKDAELCKELKKLGKPLFIVRTRFDMDTQDGNIDEVKQDILSEIVGYGIPVQCANAISENNRSTQYPASDKYLCYFISNRSVEFDYMLLMIDLYHALDKEAKKESFVFSMKNTTRAMFKMKREELQKRTWVAAAIAAAVGCVPIVGLDMAINTKILMEEATFMSQVLGIHTSESDYLTEGGLIKLLKSSDSKTLPIKVVTFIPIIGSIISSQVAYTAAKFALLEILNEFVFIAKSKVEFEEVQLDDICIEKVGC